MKRQILFLVLLFAIGSCLSKNTMQSINDAVLKEDWEMVEELATSVLQDNKHYNQNQRDVASDWLRLALLKSGNLNNKFYIYSRFREMEYPEYRTEHSIARAFLLIELGIFRPTKDFVEILTRANAPKKNDFLFWNTFEKYSYVSNKERFFISAKNELNPQYITPSANLKDFLELNKIKTTASPPDATAEMWEQITHNIIALFPIYKQNKELLEYYTLLMLYDKQLEALPGIVERYKALGYERLPDYVQEAMFIYQNITGYNIFPEELIESKTRSKVLSIFEQQNEDPDYIHTYTWHYFYAQI